MEKNKTAVVGYIPNLLFKFYLKLKDRFDPPKPSNEEEEYCKKICDFLIEIPESKLYFSPISQKRYIKNEEKEMFVVIENLTINLINHVYSYTIYFETTNLFEKIVSKFDNELERRRIVLEEEIKNNMKHSLESILNRITK